MKPAMTMHLTMVVVAGASFGRSRFRSEPFLRRFLENFENFKKPGQKRRETAFRRETPILTPVEKRLAQPQRPLRIPVLSEVVEGSWLWAG
jgi:hypothetical protein